MAHHMVFTDEDTRGGGIPLVWPQSLPEEGVANGAAHERHATKVALFEPKSLETFILCHRYSDRVGQLSHIPFDWPLL